jgi:hypothetical protein
MPKNLLYKKGHFIISGSEYGATGPAKSGSESAVPGTEFYNFSKAVTTANFVPNGTGRQDASLLLCSACHKSNVFLMD